MSKHSTILGVVDEGAGLLHLEYLTASDITGHKRKDILIPLLLDWMNNVPKNRPHCLGKECKCRWTTMERGKPPMAFAIFWPAMVDDPQNAAIAGICGRCLSRRNAAEYIRSSVRRLFKNCEEIHTPISASTEARH